MKDGVVMLRRVPDRRVTGRRLFHSQQTTVDYAYGQPEPPTATTRRPTSESDRVHPYALGDIVAYPDSCLCVLFIPAIEWYKPHLRVDLDEFPVSGDDLLAPRRRQVPASAPPRPADTGSTQPMANGPVYLSRRRSGTKSRVSVGFLS